MYKIMCEFCDKEFKTYNKKRKYCSRECAVNSQKIRIEKVCPVCGKHYETRPSNLKQGRICCSKKCSDIYKSKGEVNKKKKCKRCGCEKIYKYRISKANSSFLCEKCRLIKKIKRCVVCGRTYLYNSKNSKLCCSNNCSKILKEDSLTSKNRYCSLCGIILNSKTKTHKQTWSVCDICCYLRKKSYKIRPHIKCDDIVKMSFKLALIDTIHHQSIKGGKSCLKKANRLAMVAKRLQLIT